MSVDGTTEIKEVVIRDFTVLLKGADGREFVTERNSVTEKLMNLPISVEWCWTNGRYTYAKLIIKAKLF